MLAFSVACVVSSINVVLLEDAICRSLCGLVVPTPTYPLEPMMVSALVDVVAVPATVVVAK